jgi:prepilin peptidase CpaA
MEEGVRHRQSKLISTLASHRIIGPLPPFPLPLQILAGLLTATAAVFDWRERRIPNWLTLTGFGVALVVRAVILGWVGIFEGFQGLGLALLVYVPFYLLRAMGGGDLKLMAALGTVTGPNTWLRIFILTSILGGVIALVLILWHKAFRRALRRIGKILMALARGKAPYSIDAEIDIASNAAITSPHGVAIAAGTFIYLGLSWGAA